MNIGIITADHLRHKYFANRIIDAFGEAVVCVISEIKYYNPSSNNIKEKYIGSDTNEANKLWDWHFGLRDKMEEKYFGTETEFHIAKNKLIVLPSGSINDDANIKVIEKFNPDVFAVFGSSILKEPIIDMPKYGCVNNHMGLSPYYRGSGTNFWPLYNEEPEYVGATIHYIDTGVDTGKIIHQVRPDIEIGDNQHDIGNKTIIAGTEGVIRALREIKNDTVKSFPQKEGGTLYMRKDCTAESIKKLKTLLGNGLIEKYLKRKDTVYDKVDLIA